MGTPYVAEAKLISKPRWQRMNGKSRNGYWTALAALRRPMEQTGAEHGPDDRVQARGFSESCVPSLSCIPAGFQR